jgi:hypothetical protein
MLAILEILKAVDWRYWVILALVATIGLARLDIEHKNNQIESLNISLVKEQINNKALAESVKQLTVDSKTISDEMKKITTVNDDLSTKTDGILWNIKHKVIPNDCAGAMLELSSFTADFAKKWNVPK